MYVFHIDVESTAQTLITRSLQSISDIALAPTGDLLVIENNDRLLRLNTTTGATTLESSLSALSGPNRIAIRSNLEVFVSDPGAGRIYRVAGEVQTPIPTVARSVLTPSPTTQRPTPCSRSNAAASSSGASPPQRGSMSS